jgi:hypothetical protein
MSTPPSSSSSGKPESAGCYEAVKSLLERLGARWTLAGAFAAMQYRATPRPTNDVDFLVEHHEDLVQGLVAEGFDVRPFEDQGELHLIRVRRTDGAADLIVATTPYQHLAVRRAADHVLTVEDVLIHKLIAWRPRDRDDVESILSTGIDFDRGYVQHWADEWSVTDRWREATAED